MQLERCGGCAFCVDVRPVAALAVVEHSRLHGRRMVAVDGSLCKGCGVCLATCPKGVVVIPGLTPDGLRACVARALELD